MNRTFNHLIAALLLLGVTQAGLAQEKTLPVQEEAGATNLSNRNPDVAPGVADKEKESPASENPQDAAAAPAAAANPTNPECKLCRWLEVKTGSISFRYRTTVDNFEIRNYNQLQHREIVAGRFKFDREGRYSINLHASSGYFFNWAYAGTGIGGGNQEAIVKVNNALGRTLPQAFLDNFPLSDGGNIRLRQLYFEARPVDGLELQYGSLPILRGENSEITTFDDDGYVGGGRLSIKRPDKLFFDTIAVTYAYLGYTYRQKPSGNIEFIDDVYRPSFFQRWQHLSNSNYHQFLVHKKVNDRAAFSFDYTFHERVDYLHNAVKLKTPELKALDWVLLEAYQRIGTNTFNTYNVFGIPVYTGTQTSHSKLGYSINGGKRLHRRLAVGGGFNDIDHDFNLSNAFYTGFGFALNSDQNGLGKRFFFKAEAKLTDSLTLSTYMAKAFDVPTGRIVFNRTHVNAALTWDFLKTLKRTDWF